jgi:hypothetical protein
MRVTNDKTYVVINEDEDYCVGDMVDINNWLLLDRTPLSGLTFYELGEKVDVVIEVCQARML